MADDLIEISFVCNCLPTSDYICDKIKYFEGSYNEFFHEFLITNEPCIIRNVTNDWKSAKVWITNGGKPNIDYLKSQYGSAEVTVADCNQKHYNAQLKRSVQFSEFADYWKNLMLQNYPSSEPCLYLKDWHFAQDFPEQNVYTVPREFSNDWLNEYSLFSSEQKDDYRFVYMGPKGSWTPFHADVFLSYSWSVNICGEKKWILLPPGEEEKLKDKFGNLPYDISFLEELNNNDHYSDVKFLTVIQGVGEAIFIPSGWHHQVWNQLDTISINHNWVNACNIDKMLLSMLNHLEDVKNEINEFKNTMENWTSHCQMLLKTCFGMDFSEFHKFLSYIFETRKYYINSKKKLTVFGKYAIGDCYLKFDLKRVKEIHDIFYQHTDVKSFLKNNDSMCYSSVACHKEITM